MEAEESQPQQEKDPGLIILYGADSIIHEALNEAGSPVPQAGSPAASAAALKDYIYNVVLTTPVSEEDNGVERAEGVYFNEVFHRLSQDNYHRVIRRLKRVFVLDRTPVADWSRRVTTPPNPPLASLLRVSGGVGLGQVYITCEYLH